MTHATKICTTCSAAFKPSAADRTVRCPACRQADRDRRDAKASEAVFIDSYLSRKAAAAHEVLADPVASDAMKARAQRILDLIR